MITWISPTSSCRVVLNVTGIVPDCPYPDQRATQCDRARIVYLPCST
ncbi:MAG: hypothetical protein IPL36_12470 [Nigerium sp.]|nr:hypothetical protein [Nigerium sp.]